MMTRGRTDSFSSPLNKKPKQSRISKISQESNTMLRAAFACWAAQRLFHRRRKMIQKKANIARELLETERLYVQNLHILNDTFLKSLVSDGDRVLAKDPDLLTNITQLSSTVKVIISFHEVLLSQLEERVGSWNVHTQLGKIFEEMSSYLKTYTQYVSCYQPLIRLLKANRKNQQLSLYLAGLVSEECKGKGLRDFLIMPVQRIPRYKMMLLDLLQKTWSTHCDYEHLEQASECITEICEHVEMMSDKAIKMERKMEIAQSTTISRKWDFSLTEPHRNFQWEDRAEATIVQKPSGTRTDIPIAQVIVYSDLLLLCEPRGEKLKGISYVFYDEVAAKQRVTYNGKEIFIVFSDRVEIKISPSVSSHQDILHNLEQTFTLHDKRERLDAAVVSVIVTSDDGRPTDRRTVPIRRQRSAGATPEICETSHHSWTPPLERKLSRNISLRGIKLPFSPQQKRSLARSVDPGSAPAPNRGRKRLSLRTPPLAHAASMDDVEKAKQAPAIS